MKVIFSPEAMEDLDGLYDFIFQHNPGAAQRVLARVADLIGKLADREFDGPACTLESGESVHSWHVLNYRVFYRREEDAFHVLRIYHGARRPIAF